MSMYIYIHIYIYCSQPQCAIHFVSPFHGHAREEITIPGARARREGEKVQLCFDTQHLGGRQTSEDEASLVVSDEKKHNIKGTYWAPP